MTQTIQVLKSLANETRLSIACELARRGYEVAGSDILTSCSMALNLAQPTLSQHFTKLVAAGVLNERKAGVEKFYTLNTALLDKCGINLNAIEE